MLKRVIVQNVADSGVVALNAADPIVAGMAENCRGSVTFFAADGKHPLMTSHRAQGHRVVYVNAGMLVAAEGKTQYKVALADIPLTHNGSIGFQVENVMAAAAAAWGAGVDWDDIRAGLG